MTFDPSSIGNPVLVYDNVEDNYQVKTYNTVDNNGNVQPLLVNQTDVMADFNTILLKLYDAVAAYNNRYDIIRAQTVGIVNGVPTGQGKLSYIAQMHSMEIKRMTHEALDFTRKIDKLTENITKYDEIGIPSTDGKSASSRFHNF